MEGKQITTQEKQFAEVVDMIVQHRSHASQVVNEDILLTAWHVESQAFAKTEGDIIAQMPSAQIVQPVAGQMPNILNMTTLPNHFEILCRCKRQEERLFYILLIPQERMQEQLNEFCQFFLTDKNDGK